MAELKEQMQSLESTLVRAKESLAETQAAIAGKETIEAYLEKIKPGCDWITKHLEDRNMARGTEKEALEKAKEILKETPAYKAALQKAEVESFGDCKDTCVENK